jgi:hypothetical protein
MVEYPPRTYYVRRDWGFHYLNTNGVRVPALLVQDVYLTEDGDVMGYSQFVTIYLTQGGNEGVGGEQWFEVDGTRLLKPPKGINTGRDECSLPTNGPGSDEVLKNFGRLDDELMEAARFVGKTYIAMGMLILPGPEDVAFWGALKAAKGITRVGGKYFRKGVELAGGALKKACDEASDFYRSWKAPKTVANFTTKQLEKKWKHAVDFGITTTKRNPTTLAEYQAAITRHLDDTDTIIKGTYGWVDNSVVHFNPKTNIAVVLDDAGNFITGWKLKPGTPQFEKYITDGFLK